MVFIVKSFVMSSYVDNFMTFCVLFNTVVLGIDHYGINPNTKTFLDLANEAFTIIFFVEMCLKLFGLGVKKYMSDKMNYMDGTIVILSMVELLMQSGGAISVIRVFRIFRVFRITRLLRAMKDM